MRQTEWQQVFEGLVRGDPAAHEQVTGFVMALIRRADVRNIDVTWADICQDVLLAVVRSARNGAIRDPQAFGGYCAVITRNEISRRRAQALRSRMRHVHIDTDALLEPDRRDRDPDLRLDLERAYAGLPARVRDALQKIYLEGHTYESAAQKLGLTLGTLKSLQTAGLRMLRDTMLARAA